MCGLLARVAVQFVDKGRVLVQGSNRLGVLVASRSHTEAEKGRRGGNQSLPRDLGEDEHESGNEGGEDSKDPHAMLGKEVDKASPQEDVWQEPCVKGREADCENELSRSGVGAEPFPDALRERITLLVPDDGPSLYSREARKERAPQNVSVQ